VIVPAYNAAPTIRCCIGALGNQSVPRDDYEIIVVDDGSTDETAEIVRSLGVRYVSQANCGPASARNLGVAHARGEILLFTDADCEPMHDWIEAMSKNLLDPEIVGAKGVYRTQQKELVARFVQLEYEEKYDKMRKERYIDFIDTYSAAYRKNAFTANGGFDPTFPKASGEDVEFSFRLARKGYRMVFAPQAIVNHHHVDNLKGYLRRKYYVGYWRVLMYRRHPGKMLADSHTPQMLKIQVGLAPIMVLTLAAALFQPVFLPVTIGLAILFLLTTLGFCRQAIRKDRLVALLSPFLLLARASALSLGFLVGLVGLINNRRVDNNPQNRK